MIHSYTCRNFYSIKNEVEVRFDVNDKAPISDAYVDNIDDRLSLVEAIIGPNASGKTNTVKAVAFLRHLIAETADTDDDDDIPVSTFNNNDKPTEISALFSIKDKMYRYSFKLTRERILEEELKIRTLTNERRTYKKLLSRRWDNGEYKISGSAFPIASGLKPRRNASLISQVWRAYNDEAAGSIVKYWRDCIITNVWVFGNRDDHDHAQIHHGDTQTRQAIRALHRDHELLSKARDILRKLDVGFFDFQEVNSDAANSTSKTYRIQHRYEGEQDIIISLPYESSGTKRSILMLWYILRALNEGAVAALDEFDAYLHPDIVEFFVKLFISPVTNPKQAQLIFSSHSHQLLAELDKQQITLVEKNNKGETDVWRLDDVGGVRADDNYYNKYIAGTYNAKPRLEL